MKIDFANPKLTVFLVFAIMLGLLLLYPLVMQTENDYVFYTHYFFYFTAILFFITWKILKGTQNNRAWLILGIIILVIAILVHLMSLYIIALGKAFQH